ncbi:MAG: 1-acyl-sn-glycerol-3-phosphate acyltransferase [Muribaculaceae bacterium]|nr:1-acyl-sn-glycerol-3-phosphate acyltransferase [Muribaculaceae bacterium]
MPELLQLNLTEIIRKRAGKKARRIPGFLLRRLEKIIRQDELNEMLRVAHPAEGSEFSRRILEHLEIRVIVEGKGNLPADEQVIFASNHPLGGLDGITLVAVLGEIYGDAKIRVLVNDLLMNVTPLAPVFLPTNKFGKKGARESSQLLNEALQGGANLVMFPAGLVSRLHPDGKIRDLEWRKTFVSKALDYGLRIVPIRFEALNSRRFYRLARWRKRLGIKVNLEQAMLPAELCKSCGKTFKITFLPPVDAAALKESGLKPAEIARHIRELAGL